jgi:asparagine synthase (glutamine-hydrolysing)
MSGFFGVFSPGGDLDHLAFDQMKSAINRDGYDELDTYIDDQIAMGHLMLRVTPESVYDKQPLKSDCGRYILVGHFRLDYRDELGDKLGLTQMELELTPDSLLVMKAFQKWERKCVDHIDGDWAFVIYDRIVNELSCFKDRFGVSSLFYCKKNGDYLFSSVPHVFRNLSGTQFQIDLHQLYRISFNEIGLEENRTLFNDVFYLLANTYQIVSSFGNINSFIYTSLKSINTVRYKYEVDYILQFHSLFAGAIKSRISKLDRAGVFQSSGLDSNAILYFTAKEMEYKNKDINTYTSCNAYLDRISKKYHERISDDFLFRQSLKGYKNVTPFFLDFRNVSFKKEFENSLEDYDNPLVTKSKFWLRGIMEKAKGDMMQMMFTGQLGNFTITWDAPNILVTHLLKFRFTFFFKEFILLKKRSRLSILKVFRIFIMSPFYNYLKQLFLIHSGQKKYNLERGSVFLKPIGKPLRWRDELARKTLISNLTSKLNSNVLRESILYLNANVTGGRWYKEGFSFGIMTSDPTIDSRLVNYLFGIPEVYYNMGGATKYLFKKMMESKIYNPILNNPHTIEQSFDLRHRILADSFFRDYMLELDKTGSLFPFIDVESLKYSFRTLENSTSEVTSNKEAIKFMKNLSIVYLYTSYVQRAK